MQDVEKLNAIIRFLQLRGTTAGKTINGLYIHWDWEDQREYFSSYEEAIDALGEHR